MKKVFLVVLVLLASIATIVSCAKKVEHIEESSVAIDVDNPEETWTPPEIVKVNDVVETLSQSSVNANSFDYKIKFEYNGNDNYLKVITDDLVSLAEKYFDPESKKTVEIPTPYIVKVDDTDKSDIKVYGNFYIYGYNLNGSTFECQNSGSFPGCYHLKDDSGNISVVKSEFAEDGSNNYSSLLKICSNDEDLVKNIFSAVENDVDNKTRIEYVKMYAEKNNMAVNSIKDYGWPVIIFDDVTSTQLVFLFYKYYMLEIRQEDSLSDMPERIENLKSKYMTKEAIDRVDEVSAEIGADQIIDAQDVTDNMYDNLLVELHDSGIIVVTMDKGPDFDNKIEVKTETIDGKLKITDITVVRPESK